MIADVIVLIRKGEKRPIYGQLTAETGTLTITAATYTLYDAAGVAVTGHTAGTAVTGYDVAADADPKAWVLLDTSEAAITPGNYTLVFSLSATGSDNLARVFEPAVLVVVGAVP